MGGFRKLDSWINQLGNIFTQLTIDKSSIVYVGCCSMSTIYKVNNAYQGITVFHLSLCCLRGCIRIRYLRSKALFYFFSY